MKKIIAALSVTAMALTAAFAADVSLEFTQKADLLGDNGKLRYTGYDKNAGCVTFTLKNDNAGVYLDVDPTIAKNTETKSVGFDAYYGWVKFFDGAMKLQSGVWSSRSPNALDADGGKWNGSHYKRYNYGVMNGNTAGKDVANLTYLYSADANKLASAITYTANDLFVTGAIVDNPYDSASGLGLKSGFAAEAGVKMGEGSKINAIFKNPANKDYALGGFFETTDFKEDLDLVAGFTFGRAATNNTFEYAIDARARYTLSENMALVTMNNLSYYSSKKDFALWDMVSLSVNASEQILVTMTVQWEHKHLLNWDGKDENNDGSLDFIPGVRYKVGDGVDLTSGVVIKTTGWSKPTTATFEIPFILHVAL